MKCFVTGATGYVGNFLIEKLKQSYDVTILVRNQKDYETYQNRGYKCILADLRNPETIKGAFDGIDYVFHLGNIASWWLKRDRDYFDVNVTGTYNLLKELENTFSLVNLSTSISLVPANLFRYVCDKFKLFVLFIFHFNPVLYTLVPADS